jgi:threonine aldolase
LLALLLLALAPATTLDVESAGVDRMPAHHAFKRGHANHLNPEEAVQFFEDVRGGLPVPMHWGTFAMDREPFREPPDRLLREALRRGIEQMTIQSPGQTIPWWSGRVRGYGASPPGGAAARTLSSARAAQRDADGRPGGRPVTDPVVRIDLRSDTVTLPSAAMRSAMAAAPVGNDEYGEDPTINRLQERTAALLGKEAALWLPSGTMANQVALRVFTRPGDDVIVSRESHAVWHEAGGSAANAGVQFTEIGAGGIFTAAELLAARKPRGHPLHPPTTLVEIENTHNRMGGVVFPQAEVERVCAAARENGIATYLDGARLWNAAVASRRTVGDLARPFDLVAVALSKGLGAPGGSLLAGSREIVARGARFRRMFGGAMRQIGILGAAGLYALDHNDERLAEDHANARRIAERLAASPRIVVDLQTVQTNIIVFRLTADAPDAATVVARARERGVLVFSIGPRTIRAVTHLDVSHKQCEEAGEILAQIAESRCV